MGTVMDRLTDAPLEGARIDVRRDTQEIASVPSDASGNFELIVPIASGTRTTNLQLAVSKEGYIDSAQVVTVVAGKTIDSRYNFVLQPKALADCTSKRARRVVVGSFRPPADLPGSGDFNAQVLDALSFALKDLNLSRIRRSASPDYVACSEIKKLELLPRYAKVLKADAVVAGSVAKASQPPKFDLEVSLGSQHEPDNAQRRRVSSSNVNLDRPTAARLSNELLSGVVLGLVSGYLEAGEFAECVEISRAARQLFPKGLPREVEAVSEKCKASQGSSRLIAGDLK
ncbi:carboxypeptidase regulatory-like domain-containing protein [Aquincola sp. S2]|uniref:Carboxypeptidase regulatory-like domain-containing protein n=1 Tax=Pseudaquabacterium terrae TaxID=2732868 RepID=A0ABX2ERG6_9BURK|nr:carboxypeptidase-like regulatory domain-containing protein [Aquabacterium terrae]NRF71226.1 carboxypeptidase regulatory-like domain-containing protein [Aquabacterium terrae]